MVKSASNSAAEKEANEYRWVFADEGTADGVANPIGVEMTRANGEMVVFQTGNDIIVANDDDDEGADGYHARIMSMWDTSKGKKMVELQWYYTKADFENLDYDFEGGMLSRQEVLDSLQPKELLLSNNVDENEISVIHANKPKSRINQVVYDPTANPKALNSQDVLVAIPDTVSSRDKIVALKESYDWLCRFQIIFDPTTDHSATLEMIQGQAETKITAGKKREFKPMVDVKPKNLATSFKKRKASFAQSLFEIHSLSEDAVAKAVGQHLPRGRKKSGSTVALFFLFCYERQMVWERRNRGDDLPWTQNEVLASYYFCNNYRELDRGTNYFRELMLNRHDKFKEGTEQDWLTEVLLASVLYRLVNKVETFQAFGGIPNTPTAVQNFLKFMEEQMDMGGPAVFTSAHINMGLKSYKAVATKMVQRQTLEKIAGQVFAVRRDLSKVCRMLQTIQNVGAFYAWQVTCDLMECGCLPDCTENDYAKLGKGAVKGIELLFGTTTIDVQVELAKLLQSIQVPVFHALNVKFPYFAGRELTVKNIEHALCEFSKFAAIQKRMKARKPVIGQRLRKSRSSLDASKACLCGEDKQVVMCDTCLLAYCQDCLCCEIPTNHWICRRCREFSA